jgi:hypothetical protein
VIVAPPRGRAPARERQAVEVGELDARHRATLPTIVAGVLVDLEVEAAG